MLGRSGSRTAGLPQVQLLDSKWGARPHIACCLRLSLTCDGLTGTLHDNLTGRFRRGSGRGVRTRPCTGHGNSGRSGCIAARGQAGVRE